MFITDHDTTVTLPSTAHNEMKLPHELKPDVKNDDLSQEACLMDNTASLDGFPPNIRAERSATLSDSFRYVDKDIVFTQSLPASSCSSTSEQLPKIPKRGM